VLVITGSSAPGPAQPLLPKHLVTHTGLLGEPVYGEMLRHCADLNLYEVGLLILPG
jgi:hypothetical protein